MRYAHSPPDGPSQVIETKVALPAVVVACLTVLAGAVYGLARAYGFNPTPDQDLAILGLGTAVQYVAYVAVGYLAPHTPRPDVPHPVEQKEHS